MSKRRGHGDDALYRKGKLWVAVLDLGWVDGKRKRQWYYGRTQQEVREKLDAAKSARAAGLPVAVRKQTVEAYLTSWLETKRDLRSRTWHRYEEYVRKHITPTLGKLSLAAARPPAPADPCTRSAKPRCHAQASVSFAPCYMPLSSKPPSTECWHGMSPIL